MTDLEQSNFFLEEDCDLLLTREEQEQTKRYTAAGLKQLEWKRNAVLMLVGAGVPTETIARQLHVNHRTVRALATSAAEKVAAFSKEYAGRLLRMGAGAFELAFMKREEASTLQLATFGGIVTDKALALLAMGEMGEEKIVKEEEDEVRTLAELRRLMAGEQGVPKTPAGTGDKTGAETDEKQEPK